MTEHWQDMIPPFKSGREFLDWIIEGSWMGNIEGPFGHYWYMIKQAVNPVSYDVPIPEETMCEALERTLRTGEMIDIEPDTEFLVPPPEERQLDGWTYHIEFVSADGYFQVETPPSPPEEIDQQRAFRFINNVEWHFAKTMPQIPHWYCLLKECEDKEEFLWFARYIQAYSKPGQFYGRTYHYCYLGKYKYWMMDERPEDCDLINRDEAKL